MFFSPFVLDKMSVSSLCFTFPYYRGTAILYTHLWGWCVLEDGRCTGVLLFRMHCSTQHCSPQTSNVSPESSAPRQAFCLPVKCMQEKKNPDAKAKPAMCQWGWLSLRGSAHACSCLVQQAEIPTTRGCTPEHPSSLPVNILFWHCLLVTRFSWYQLTTKYPRCPQNLCSSGLKVTPHLYECLCQKKLVFNLGERSLDHIRTCFSCIILMYFFPFLCLFW